MSEIQQENKLTPQEQEQQNEALKLKNQEELKSFTPEKTKELIEKTWELLTIDEAEKAEIVKNLGAEAPAFLAEINQLDNKFKAIIWDKYKQVENLTKEEYEQQMKLFFEKLIPFKNKNEKILEKIDENDWNWISEKIYETRYDKEKHDWFFDTFDAIKDWLPNWLLLWIQKYEKLLDLDINWINKLVDNISNMIEKEWLLDFLENIIWSIWEDLKKMLDFDQPTYKIAQAIWKFLIDIIMSLATWWLGTWIKVFTKINSISSKFNKLIPDWLIKDSVKYAWKTTDEFLKAFTWVKPELLSKEWLKEMWLIKSWTAIWNELMYYSGNTPYIMIREWAKQTLNLIEQIQKQGFTFNTLKPKVFQTPDWKTFVKLMKYEEKLELKTIEKTLRLLTWIKKKEVTPTINQLVEVSKKAWVYEKWNNRFDSLIKEKDLSKTNFFQEIYAILESKYKKYNKNYIV